MLGNQDSDMQRGHSGQQPARKRSLTRARSAATLFLFLPRRLECVARAAPHDDVLPRGSPQTAVRSNIRQPRSNTHRAPPPQACTTHVRCDTHPAAHTRDDGDNNDGGMNELSRDDPPRLRHGAAKHAATGGASVPSTWSPATGEGGASSAAAGASSSAVSSATLLPSSAASPAMAPQASPDGERLTSSASVASTTATPPRHARLQGWRWCCCRCETRTLPTDDSSLGVASLRSSVGRCKERMRR